MAAPPWPFVKPQYFDNNGVVADSYRLFFYEAGTSTKLDTYDDADLNSLNTNPVVLDSAGRANIFPLPQAYKVVFAAPGSDDPPSSPIWTVDDVIPSSGFTQNVDVVGTAGATIAIGDCVYVSNGASNTAGRWYLADADTADFVSSTSVGVVAIGFATTAATNGDPVTVRVAGKVEGLSGLVAGLPFYVSTTAGQITSSDPGGSSGTVSQGVGTALSATTLVVAIQPPSAAMNASLQGAAGIIRADDQWFGGVKHFREQPLVVIGDATANEATVGGRFFVDVTAHPVAGASTDLVLTNTTIPANMLNANGKALRLHIGSSVTETGANAKVIELLVGVTQLVLRASSVTNNAYWMADVVIVRIDSDSVDVTVTQGVVSSMLPVVTRINSLDFTAAIPLQTLGTTGAASTTEQTYFIAEALG